MFDQSAITGFDPSLETQGYGMVRTDHQLPAEFYYKEKRVSAAHETPKFDKVEYIKIYLPGGDIVDRPANDNDRYQYPRHYAAFKKNEDQSAVGWPIEQVPWLDVAQVATYKALNIRTVEGLANAPDTAIQGIMGALTHREQAKRALEMMAGQEPMLKLVAEKEQLQSQIDLQAAQIKELCARIDQLQDKKPPKERKE